ncbi:survival factor 1 [Exophiala viscosa]|uniref:Ceramide-binding protein SVF1 n=1 Tax=Exophiala viscosa TaxID=2486360 RepID=A0AAN6I835_9EURO|nr:survival factor 1 [Exophiala viscosa]KAI1619983.1 survival factor 1 [Exophiala viscosa]
MNWFKQQLANVVGTEEPEYGSTAIRPVTKQAETKPYSVLKRNDLQWKGLERTNVETETFYMFSEDGTTSMAQVIYSNVGGIHTTCQFNSKIFDYEGPGKHQFCSDPLNNYGFDEEKTGFYADDVAMELNEAGDAYTIKSARNEHCIVNLTVTRIAPGFQVGEDGTSYYGTNPAEPWGELRHAFWPRCTVSGTMQTPKKTYQVKGRAMYSYALMDMKPHHLACRWNFLNLQTPTYSAILMEFTTPQSYGKTVVSVGGIAKDNEIVTAGVCRAKHVTSLQETETDWPEPREVSFEWLDQNGSVVGEVKGELPKRADRVEVLAHLPAFVKSFIKGATGLKPHIFQYCSKDEATLKLKDGEKEVSEPGQLFCEATFIS